MSISLLVILDATFVMILAGMGSVIRSLFNGGPLSERNTFEVFVIGMFGGLVGLSLIALIGFQMKVPGIDSITVAWFGIFVLLGFVTPDIFSFVLKLSRKYLPKNGDKK